MCFFLLYNKTEREREIETERRIERRYIYVSFMCFSNKTEREGGEREEGERGRAI